MASFYSNDNINIQSDESTASDISISSVANQSYLSDVNSEFDQNPILVIIQNRPSTTISYQNFQKSLTVQNDVLIKIKNNVVEKMSVPLPTVSVINARSLWPKLDSFSTQFKETNTRLFA